MKTTQTKSWLLARVTMMALLLGVATQAKAWGYLYLSDFDIAPGETKTLAIQFDDYEDEVDYVAFQFDLCLPEGLTIVKQDSKPDLRFHEDRISDHSFSSATQTDGALRVFGISLNNSIFRGTSGDFVYFTVTAADDFDGSHEVKLQKVMFSTAQGQRDEMSEAVATATARHWTFNAETGHLFVNDDDYYNGAPWRSLSEQVKSVEFGPRVTRIADYACSEFPSLASIIIPANVKIIGCGAFISCRSLTSVTIPDGVTHIEETAFYVCTSLENVTLPDGLISIGNSAFGECKVLSSINIPASVTNIGSGAFSYCYKLSNITIPEGVERIKESTFINCSALTSITIPANVTAIEDLAFYECPNLKEVINLSGLDIVKGAETHGRVALYADKVWTRGVHLDCTERGLLIGDQFTLEATVIPAGPSVTWSSSNPSVAAVDNNGVVTGVGESTAVITATAGNYSATCTVTVSKKVIPVTGIELNKTSATIIIGNTLTLEATVTPVDATDKTVIWASSDEWVATVNANGVVTPIADGTATIIATAGNCSATCTVTVQGWSFDEATGKLYVNKNYYNYSPESYPWHDVRELITSVEFGPNVTSIGEYAFSGCSSLTSINIPSGVTSIGDGVFAGCSKLTNITIPEGVTSIGDIAFANCSSLTSINIPSGVTSIGNDAFYNCSSLESITIPEGVTSIGNEAFQNCSALTSVSIPNSVTSIGYRAFYNCSSLESITIPEGVTSIGNYAFYGCYALKTVINLSALNVEKGSDSYGCLGYYATTLFNASTGHLYLNENYDYDNHESYPWHAVRGQIKSVEFGTNVTCIGKWAFRDCSALTSLDLPANITEIPYGMCWGCSALESITIPEGVTTIGGDAFFVCTSLTSVDIPNSVTNIGDYAFQNCSRLVNITIPEGVTGIANQTFDGCSSLSSITIPANVTSIGGAAFLNCSNLKTVINLSDLDIEAGSENHGFVAYYAEKVWTRGVHLDCTERGLLVGDQFTLEATVIPAGPSVTWSSSNESVATVDNGVVTGVGEGTATITASAGNYSATCTVTVEAAVVEPEPEGLVVGRNYRIKNVSAELYLQASSNNTNMQLHAQGEKLSQIFQLEMAEEGKYYIKVADAENSYYAHASLWNFNATTNADNKTPFTIELVENEEAVYTLHQATSDNPGYVGADATSEGASVYCDKGIGNNGKWTFEAVADDEYIAILRAELGAAIDGANDVVNTRSTILSTEGIDAINTAVAHAENLKDNLDDWATLNTLFKEINDAVCGAIYVNDLNELNNNVCYVVSTEDRGSWYSDSDAERLNSTTKLGVPFDVTNPKQQFAFVTPDGGNTYYLYSVSEKKFVSEEMTAEEIYYTQLTDAPVQTITFLNGVRSEAFPWVVALNTEVGEKQIAVSNSYAYGVITYNDLGDAGNTVRFEKAAAFDPAEALVHFVTDVELNADAATLTEGESMTLTATILPNTITGVTVEWSTSNAAIATVENGVVTAVAAGTATITASAGNYSATCTVTVEAAVVEPEPEPELEGIASISELSNDKLYLVAQLKRGNTAWAVAENGEALKSNVDLSIGVDAEDSRQHFAFIKHNDRFYLYHAAEKMFVSKDGSLNVQPVDAINITSSTVFDGTFVMYFDDMHYINVDGNGYMAVNDWATHDGGNSCSIIPVGDFDPTDALKALENLDTRIENAELNAQCSLLIYDLTGRRVLSTENLKGGIYIVNGKKVIVK